MTILNTTSHASGDRIQLISFAVGELVKIALETALNDGNGLAGLNEDTEITLEVATQNDEHEGTTFARFEVGTDFDIVRELDGTLRVIGLQNEGGHEASVHLMIVNPGAEKEEIAT